MMPKDNSVDFVKQASILFAACLLLQFEENCFTIRAARIHMAILKSIAMVFKG